jgi:hypothetical protein
METGMKNYIANGKGDWATSAAFVKYSFERSIHHGRLYTNGHGFFKGKDEDLAEGLRCLGQGLHTLEDFGAHTNYVELSLRELGFHNIFPHVGTATAINLHGKHVFPLVTGTFGMVDFYHSVLGEATDHFTQSEVNEMDNALGTAQQAAQSSNPLMTLVKLLSKVPGTKELCDEAEQLQASSQAQARAIEQQNYGGGSGFRGVADYSGSSRGVDDWESTRASQAGFPGQSQGYNTSSDWNQGYQQSQWGQGASHGQQQWHDQGAQNYNNPQHQSQWHDSSASQSYNNPQHQNQWQTSGQNYNAQDQYPGAQHNWQQPPQTDSWQQQQTPHVPQHSQQQPATTAQPPSQSGSTAPTGLPGMPNFDPAKTVAQIYPILVFRDKVVRTISSIIEKIPGLEALVERITETLTVFILSLLAPFVRPVINGISKALQSGSSEVLDSEKRHQFEVWTNPHSSDPTHSMLSKDHFSNILNEPAGNVAAEILKFIAPRVLYAWEHPDVPVEQVMRDVESIFHHPAIRNEGNECHRNMFAAVKKWIDGMSDRGRHLEDVLSSEAVKAGKNHKAGVPNPHKPPAGVGQSHAGSGGLGGLAGFIPGQQQHGSGGNHSSGGGLGGLGGLANLIPGQHQGGGHQGGSGGLGGLMNLIPGQNAGGGHGGHGGSPLGAVGDILGNFTGQHKPAPQHGGGGGLNSMLGLAEKLPIPGASSLNKYSKFFPGGGARGLDEGDIGPGGVGPEVGGSSELLEAAAHADRYGPDATSPSPMPMQAPPGYEQYGRQEPGSYGYGQDGSQYQYNTNYQDPYSSQGQYGSGSGQSAGYYGRQ